MDARYLKLDKQNNVTISAVSEPKLILINDGKVKEVNLPFQGEVVVKVAQGRIHNYETIVKELF